MLGQSELAQGRAAHDRGQRGDVHRLLCLRTNHLQKASNCKRFGRDFEDGLRRGLASHGVDREMGKELVGGIDDVLGGRDGCGELGLFDLFAGVGGVFELGAASAEGPVRGEVVTELRANSVFDAEVPPFWVARRPWWASTPTSAKRAAS